MKLKVVLLTKAKNLNVFKGLLVFLCLTFIKCDCYQNVSGTVVDSETKKPIDSVYVHKITKDYGEYTSEKGTFEIHATSGGLFGCPPMKGIKPKTCGLIKFMCIN